MSLYLRIINSNKINLKINFLMNNFKKMIIVKKILAILILFNIINKSLIMMI